MSDIFHKHRAMAVVVLLATAFCLLLFFPVLEKLDSHTFGSGLDAAKNAYTPYYHIVHDTSWWHFDGMNYPFGEHVVYTDNQPLFSNLLKIVHRVLPLDNHFILLFNLLLLFSIPVAVWILFRLLIVFGSEKWPVVVFALGIVFLSPQLSKFTGHYALAYLWAFPLAIYLSFSFVRAPSVKNALLIACFLFALGFVHPYLLLISSTVVFAMQLVNLLLARVRGPKISLQKMVLSMGQALFPVVLFYVAMKLGDDVSDRPADPYGFLVYRAPLMTMLLPLKFPWFQNLGLGIDYTFTGEETAYLGIVAVVGLVWLAVPVLFAGRKWLDRVSSDGAYRLVYLCYFSGLAIMVIAQAIPFVYDPSGRFLDLLGPLRQFRGLGRFAMASYYLLNLAAFGYLLLQLKNLNVRWKTTVAVLAGAVILLEAFLWSTSIQEALVKSPFALLEKPMEEMDVSEYQAIISLPYMHEGSENFRTQEDERTMARAFQVSAQTGLPMLNVVMSRTSYSQAVQNLALMAHLLKSPDILEKVNEKPFLLISDTHAVVLPFERQVLDHSKLLYADGGFQYHRLEKGTFSQILRKNRSTASMDASNALAIEGGMTEDGFYFQDFHGRKTEVAFRGEGALSSVRNQGTVLFEGSLPSGRYELSFWYYIKNQQTVSAQFAHGEKGPEGEVLKYELYEVADLRTAFLDDWMLATYTFGPVSPDAEINIFLYREGPAVPLVVDEILLRPLSMNVKTRSDTLNVNNRYYP